MAILGYMFKIDASVGRAPFEQLKDQLIDKIATGELVAGDRLPTVRALAAELGIAANTVARSYRELEADDLIVTRGRAGTAVAFGGDPTSRLAQSAARAYLARALELGLDGERACQILSEVVRPTR